VNTASPGTRGSPVFRSILQSGLAFFLGCLLLGCSRAERTVHPLHFNWPLTRDATSQIPLVVPFGYVAAGSGGFELSRVAAQPGFSLEGTQASLSFEALWPEMDGKTPKNRLEFEVPGGGNVLMVLVQSGALDTFQGKSFDALSLHGKVAMDFLQNVCVPTGQAMPNNVRCSHLEPTILREQFGLAIKGRDYKAYPILRDSGPSAKDVLEERDASGNLVTLIQCTPDDVPHPTSFTPRCQEDFVQSDINGIVKVYFRKALLPDWKVIRSKTSVLLTSFIRA